MNVIILSTQRNRSSFLTESYSNEFNLSNWFEKYDLISVMEQEELRLNLLKKENKKELLFEKQKKFLNQITKSVKDNDNVVIKLFTHSLIERPYFLENINILPRIITDLSTILNVYDKIVYIDRNIIDSTISYIYAVVMSSFLYSDKILLDYHKTKSKPIKIEDNKLPIINYQVYQHVIHQHVKTFIENNYNNTTFLTYDNCVDYVKNNFKNEKQNFFINANFDYRQLITNYDEISDHILRTKEHFEKNVPLTNFT